MRLPDESPARLALKEALRPVKRPSGKPKLTWLGLITKELAQVHVTLDIDRLQEVVELANDREAWAALIGRAMSTQTNRRY